MPIDERHADEIHMHYYHFDHGAYRATMGRTRSFRSITFHFKIITKTRRRRAIIFFYDMRRNARQQLGKQ